MTIIFKTLVFYFNNTEKLKHRLTEQFYLQKSNNIIYYKEICFCCCDKHCAVRLRSRKHY